MSRAICFLAWVVIAACGGRIAPIEPAGVEPIETKSAPGPEPTTAPEPLPPADDPVLPVLTSPSECIRQDPAKSIIATSCRPGTCTNEPLAELVRDCPCGSYRLKVVDSNCIEAVESWERSVACVAKVALGSHLCGIDAGDDAACIDLTIPCGGGGRTR
jgi:hypothetical protein